MDSHEYNNNVVLHEYRSDANNPFIHDMGLKQELMAKMHEILMFLSRYNAIINFVTMPQV